METSAGLMPELASGYPIHEVDQVRHGDVDHGVDLHPVDRRTGSAVATGAFVRIRLGRPVLPRFLCFALSILSFVFGISMLVQFITGSLSDVGNATIDSERNLRALWAHLPFAEYVPIDGFFDNMAARLDLSANVTTVAVSFTGIARDSLLIFLLNFIPTIGSIVATLFPSLMALAQSSDGFGLFFAVLLGITSLQILIGNIIEPRITGRSLNLSPVVILFNLALWGSIWGVPGMFMCVPLLIITTIVLAHFPRTRPIAILLSSDGRVNITED